MWKHTKGGIDLGLRFLYLLVNKSGAILAIQSKKVDLLRYPIHEV